MSERYAESVFRSTHNSYSGAGRGSLPAQLDRGVRMLELDLVSNDYRRHGYRLGHGLPGMEVAKGGGNPGDVRLESWLATIAAWCDRTDGHIPVTIVLDPKSDLTRPDGFGDGNLAALNHRIREAFGERLYTAEKLGDGDWPALGELRGSVICVLSGNLATRRGYVSDGGREPAVAIDDGGRVVEVHSSRRGDLWYWSGRRSGGAIAWERHGRIGSGRSPAVALAGDGVVVAVHGGGGADLSWRLGSIDDDSLEVSWGPARKAAPTATGRPAPTVRMLDAGRLRVTYETEFGRLAREGVLEVDSVTWDTDPAPATAADASFHPNHARSGTAEVTVLAVPRSNGDGERLVYGTEAMDAAPIAYRQLLFVEGQWVPEDGDGDIAKDRRFVASLAAPGAQARLRKWRDHGKLVRLWQFGEDHTRMPVPPNFPATDHPQAEWYERYCGRHGAA